MDLLILIKKVNWKRGIKSILRIEIKIGANQIKEFISIDSDDPDVLGVYSLNDNDLKKFGITNYDETSISFFITSEL